MTLTNVKNPGWIGNIGISGASATVTVQNDQIASDFSTTSTSFVDITGASITVANRAGGKFFCSVSADSVQQTTQNAKVHMTINNGGTDELGGVNELDNISIVLSLGVSAVGDLDGRVLKGRSKVGSGENLTNALRYEMAVIEISDGDNLAAQRVDSAADFSTTSTTYVDITGQSLTIGNFAGGKYIAQGNATAENSAVAGFTHTQLVHGSTEYIGGSSANTATDANDEFTQHTVLLEDTDGNTLKMQARVTSGTGNLRHVASTNGHYITTLEFSMSNTITTSMDVLTSDFTTVSASYVDITGLTETLQSSGIYFTISSLPQSINFDGGFCETTLSDGGTEIQDAGARSEDTATRPNTINVCHGGNSTGQVLKLRGRRPGASGTSRWHGDTVKACRFVVLQID